MITGDHHPVRNAPERFRFTGNGSEYFGIWIVNLLLTIVTLGIYSPWAKVRRLKYFYGNTELAGASFDYHGDPLAILKGRLLALGLFILYNAATSVASVWSVVGLVFLALLLPWLLRSSFRFRLRYSSYRGLHFGFHGSNAGAYWVFLAHLLLMFFTLYLTAPLFHARLKQYQHNNSRYGTAPFSFHAGAAGFYAAYLPVFGILIAMVVVMFVSIGSLQLGVDGEKPDPQAVVSIMGTMFLVLIGGMLLINPVWQALTQNLVWNNTRLGEHRFQSNLGVFPLMWIQVSNFVLVVLTLGFFAPWAAVRVARYRAECMQMIPAGSLDEFVAEQQRALEAVGEESAEVFDIDIGL